MWQKLYKRWLLWKKCEKGLEKGWVAQSWVDNTSHPPEQPICWYWVLLQGMPEGTNIFYLPVGSLYLGQLPCIAQLGLLIQRDHLIYSRSKAGVTTWGQCGPGNNVGLKGIPVSTKCKMTGPMPTTCSPYSCLQYTLN